MDSDFVVIFLSDCWSGIEFLSIPYTYSKSAPGWRGQAVLRHACPCTNVQGSLAALSDSKKSVGFLQIRESPPVASRTETKIGMPWKSITRSAGETNTVPDAMARI